MMSLNAVAVSWTTEYSLLAMEPMEERTTGLLRTGKYFSLLKKKVDFF